MQEEIVINPLNEKIEKALDKIRPYLETDGGNVQVIELTEDLILRVKFMGACSSCSMSAMTFKGGIEDTIRREVPEIVKVEVVA